jgi:hypothetical protein
MLAPLAHLALFALLVLGWHLPWQPSACPLPALASLKAAVRQQQQRLPPPAPLPPAQLGLALHFSVVLVNAPRRHALRQDLPGLLAAVLRRLQLPAYPLSVFEASAQPKPHLTPEEQFDYLFDYTGLKLFVDSFPRSVRQVAVVVLFEGEEAQLLGRPDSYDRLFIKAGSVHDLARPLKSAFYHALVQPAAGPSPESEQAFRTNAYQGFYQALLEDLSHLEQVCRHEIYSKAGVARKAEEAKALLEGLGGGFEQDYWRAGGYRFAAGDAALGELDTFSSDYKLGVLFPLFLAAVYPFCYLLFLQCKNAVFVSA